MLSTMFAMRLLLVALALVVAGCGRFGTSGPSPTPQDSAFQALIASPPDPQGNTTTTRFDSTTGRDQRTSAPADATATQFAGSGRISYLVTDRIRSMDVAGSAARTEAASSTLSIAAYAWSSGGALAYLTRPPYAGSPRGSELVIERPGASTTTVPLASASAWGGDPPRLQFSPDGQLLLVDTASALQVRRLDGRLVFAPASSAAGTPSAGAWAGNRKLYFWDGRGVNVANLAGGTVRTVLPGVRWYRPDTSPGGKMIVFEELDRPGAPCMMLLDTTNDALVSGYERDGATLARFVSSTEVWFHEAQGPQVSSEIHMLDTSRLTEAPTGLSGFVTDVRSG